MSRYSAGWRTTGAGSTTLPMAGIPGLTTCRPRIREIGCFNSTATAVSIALRRLTSAGTPGSSITVNKESDVTQTALMVPKDTWTSTGPSMVGNAFRVADLGAAIGSGVIWTFDGLVIDALTTDGIVLIPLAGTGQVCDVYFVWDE